MEAPDTSDQKPVVIRLDSERVTILPDVPPPPGPDFELRSREGGLRAELDCLIACPVSVSYSNFSVCPAMHAEVGVKMIATLPALILPAGGLADGPAVRD